MQQEVLFQNNLVIMNGKGRDIDHIHANGIDRNDWTSSRALHGTIDSSPLREVVRGVNRLQFTPGAKPRYLRYELGGSGANTATFTYRAGHVYQANQQSGTGSAYYCCTEIQLRWFSAERDLRPGDESQPEDRARMIRAAQSLTGSPDCVAY